MQAVSRGAVRTSNPGDTSLMGAAWRPAEVRVQKASTVKARISLFISSLDISPGYHFMLEMTSRIIRIMYFNKRTEKSRNTVLSFIMTDDKMITS
jgi:hypothetical protein